jgi:NADH:ubiquinone oxidoreductase subunit 6 (subunit J)
LNRDGIMQIFARLLIVVLICLCCLGTLYVGFVFVLASGFIFAGDIDLTEQQRESAQTKVVLGALFGVFLMLGSMFMMVASGIISKKILKLFGVKSEKE